MFVPVRLSEWRQVATFSMLRSPLNCAVLDIREWKRIGFLIPTVAVCQKFNEVQVAIKALLHRWAGLWSCLRKAVLQLQHPWEDQKCLLFAIHKNHTKKNRKTSTTSRWKHLNIWCEVLRSQTPKSLNCFRQSTQCTSIPWLLGHGKLTI